MQASEVIDTSTGRHNSRVLRKRFPQCEVLTPKQRLVTPIPSKGSILTVTALCKNHSKLNPSRNPWKTEELLEPVFERLRRAPNIQVVVMENVPEYLQPIDGQECSSYANWLEELETAGFRQHAYALFPTWVCGDLHSRCRLISVHTVSSSLVELKNSRTALSTQVS